MKMRRVIWALHVGLNKDDWLMVREAMLCIENDAERDLVKRCFLGREYREMERMSRD